MKCTVLVIRHHGGHTFSTHLGEDEVRRPTICFWMILVNFWKQIFGFKDRILGNREFLVMSDRISRVSSRDKDWCVEVHTSYPHGAERSFGENAGRQVPCTLPSARGKIEEKICNKQKHAVTSSSIESQTHGRSCVILSKHRGDLASGFSVVLPDCSYSLFCEVSHLTMMPVSDGTLSSPTLPLHCSSNLQPATSTHVVTFEPWTISQIYSQI